MSSSRGFAIRHAETADAAAVAALCTQLGYPVEAEVIARRLDRLLKLPTQAVFVACDEDDAVHGFVATEQRLILEIGDRVEVVALVVDEAARRHGAGRALMTAAELWAHKRGVSEVFLRSNVLRAESHPFYESLGYARTKTQHAYARSL